MEKQENSLEHSLFSEPNPSIYLQKNGATWLDLGHVGAAEFSSDAQAKQPASGC
jgi:hypothetical protein